MKTGVHIFVLFVFVFMLGWLANSMYSFLINMDREQPFSFGSNEIKSPGDWVKEDDIKMRDKAVILMVRNATWSKFTDTNSMDPVIDDSSHAIKIVPGEPDELDLGDIISYESDIGVVIHRIVDKGKDSSGVYFITKGDNNKYPDKSKVRFDQVTGVVVGIAY